MENTVSGEGAFCVVTRVETPKHVRDPRLGWYEDLCKMPITECKSDGRNVTDIWVNNEKLRFFEEVANGRY